MFDWMAEAEASNNKATEVTILDTNDCAPHRIFHANKSIAVVLCRLRAFFVNRPHCKEASKRFEFISDHKRIFFASFWKLK
jgi:hypothetical protein